MASLGEFEFIDRLLKTRAAQGQALLRHPQALGIGDDAALIPEWPAGEQCVVASDMLIEGRHYFPDVDPAALGHKVLAVNLSDLAAMGARPVAFTLAVALRSMDEPWITAFLDGMLALAREAQCPLMGGDTTGLPGQAPQVFCATVIGAVPVGQALRRDGLRHGDDLWVSASLGDAAYALARKASCEKLLRPSPRLALGQRLRGVATAAIDISDGLQSEIMHLLKSSSTRSESKGLFAAQMSLDGLPLGPDLQSAVASQQITADQAMAYAITGGDEYELLFAANPRDRSTVRDLGYQLGIALTRIGSVSMVENTDRHTIAWRDAQGHAPADPLQARIDRGGFTHF
jgi:thiamine-monophosphate kinase